MKMNANTEKRLLKLRLVFAIRVKKLLDLAYANGLNAQISCGYRSAEEQDALYSVGRTRPGKIVTNAQAGQSAHNYGLAVDIFFLTPDGKADFSSKLYTKLDKLAKAAGIYDEGIGMEWSGMWTGSLKETAHWQVKGFNWRKWKKASLS